MYMRFVSPWRSRVMGHDIGVFQYSWYAARDRAVPVFLRQAIDWENDWFNKFLPVPPYGLFYVKSKKRWYAKGICWFRPEARVMIRHAFALKALMDEAGYPVSVLKTDIPGTILYQDDCQIVAKPQPGTHVCRA